MVLQCCSGSATHGRTPATLHQSCSRRIVIVSTLNVQSRNFDLQTMYIVHISGGRLLTKKLDSEVVRKSPLGPVSLDNVEIL